MIAYLGVERSDIRHYVGLPFLFKCAVTLMHLKNIMVAENVGFSCLYLLVFNFDLILNLTPLA